METIFGQTLSDDNQLRRYAANRLQQLQGINYPKYAYYIYKLLSSNDINDNIRLSAGISFKNSLSKPHWSQETMASKNIIESNIISLLEIKNKNVVKVVSQITAAIALIELPLGNWKDLIDILLNNVISPLSTCEKKQSTLQTIGYICESLDPITLSVNQCNAIITAIIDGACREQNSLDIRLTAIKALYNSLEFAERNFDNVVERDYIIKVVCDGAIQHSDSDIELQVSSYECLNRIVQLYYHKMDWTMANSLFNLTIDGLAQSDPKIKLQAIELWCTICEIETDLKEKNSYTVYSFSNQYVSHIIPSLFKLLVKDENYIDQQEDDELNIPRAASHCLSLFAQCCKEALLPQTIDFISKNLFETNTSSHQKEAGIIAFGSILHGPCKYNTEQLVNQILPTLLSSMQDATIFIRTAASWTLAKIIKESIQVLNVDRVLYDMIPVLIRGLYEHDQHIVYNSCLCFIYLYEELKQHKTSTSTVDQHTPFTSGPLSSYTDSILTELLKITQIADTNYDTKYRNVIYEAIDSIINHSTKDCIKSITLVASHILNRVEKVNAALVQIKTNIYGDFWSLQTSLLVVLTSCIYRISKEEVISLSDRIMTAVNEIAELNLLSDQQEDDVTVVEDAFLLVSALINTTGLSFLRHMNRFLPNLSKAMNKQQLPPEIKSDSLSIISVGIISDLSCTCGESIFPYAEKFMKLLLNNLQSETLHREVKPVTLSCIGDIAQALGPLFKPFINVVMMALKQAGNMQTDKNNLSSADYVNAIRVGTLEAFVGVLQGASQLDLTRDFLFQYVTDMILFLNNIAMDQAKSNKLTQHIFGVLGDIARIYGKRVKCSLIEVPLNHLIIEHSKGNLHFSKGTREMAHWAQQTVTSVYYK